MIKNYIFTIVTPTFNSDGLIVRCMMNLQKNNVPFEHIIVDDYSKDSTISVIEKYIQENSINNIKLIRMDKNVGPGPARNKALDIAEGKYIIFCDADDYLYPGALDNIERNLIHYNEPDLCVFGYRIDNGNRESTILPPHNKTIAVDVERCKKDYILDEIVSAPWAKVIKKTLLNNNTSRERFPDLRRAQDGIFNLDIFLKSESCLYMAEPLYYFDKTGDSLTRKIFNEQEFQYLYESWMVFEEKLKKISLYKKELIARKLRFICINYIFRIAISSKNKDYIIPNVVKTTIRETAFKNKYFSCYYLSWKEKILITMFLIHPTLGVFLINYREKIESVISK